MLLDDRLADREAEAGASLLARIGRLQLSESLEDRQAVGHRHTAAAVGDPELDPTLPQPDTDCHHAAWRRELHRVGQQIDR